MKYFLVILLVFNLSAKDFEVVNFALWGGSENINKWIDGFVSKELMKKHKIKLNRVPLTDTEIAIKKLIRDKKKIRKVGSIDLLWVNGENFKVMKEKKLTWKSYLSELENSKFLNKDDMSLYFDFGVDHQGHESPWGSAQMVMIYNSEKVPNPPESIKDLKEWVKKNQGRFTYSSPPDFTGSAFLRLLFLQITDEKSYESLLKNIDRDLYEKSTRPLWDFLLEIKPYLYRRGKNYPQNISKLHQLFSDEVIWLTFDYYPTTAQRMINKGVFPKSTKTYVMEKGVISNTHFVSIPFNAPSKEAAKKVADFLLSPEAQLSKMRPENWGDLTVLSLGKLGKKDRSKFTNLDLGSSTLDLKTLSDSKKAELPSEYVPWFEKDWKNKILR